MKKLSELAAQLETRQVSSRELVEECLDKINAPDGEGARVFTSVNAADARAQADQMDALRKAGKAPTALTGIPVSIKDLFDVEGEVTQAGSKVRANDAPALSDATIVQRLRRAGLVIIGRTNMTEFAYSGLGLNPHFGTPLNPFDREIGRIPGGSSSGAAVSVSDGMAAAGIGTDTGGSCRIPAAFCGLTGFKPTASRVPLNGAFPLSKSLDSIGPIAPTVECCHRIDAILAGQSQDNLQAISRAPRLGVLQNYVMDNTDNHVAKTYEQALARLAASGVELVDLKLPFLEELPGLNARGGVIAAEAYDIHKARLEQSERSYDPRVSVRILKAREQASDEYRDLLETRARMIGEANSATSKLDAVIFPTVPVIAPTLAELEDEDTYGRTNLLALRNPTVANFLDRCAISIPIHEKGTAPVGLMIMGETLADQDLFSVAARLEAILRPDVANSRAKT